MALELVTGYKGQNHVTADQWADFNRSIYGNAAILPVGNKMAVEIQTANQITVKDGVAVFDGRQIYIGYGESENVAIESGTQAMLRNDIVVVKYTKNEETGVESVAFEAITGTPAASDPVDPSYQDMDIRTGVFTSQKAFCRVRLNGVAIESIDMLVDVKEINEHAFAAPANNLTTATPGTALDAAMGKKLQEEYDQLNGDIISITENKEATITPITGLEFTNNTIPVKNGVAYLNIQLSNKTTTAVDMANGKVIATGFPIPYKKRFQYTEAIPWNNGFLGTDAKTTPLRLCINGSGQLCSYYPNTNEKINVGMPICINMAYPVDE